jgi:alpha-2-macroglobulin
VAPDRFGRQTLTAYFRKIVADPKESRERAIIATYGLAALGEPVLGDVKAIAALSDLTWRERLYAGLAAAALGDDDTARRVYRGLLEDYGEQRGPWVRIKAGADEDEILEATSMLAIIGASLGDDLAVGIFGYTEENRTVDVLVELEQISYLRRALPRLPANEVTFEYTLNGERKRESLERGATFALRLSPEQLRDLAPVAVDGPVGVSTLFLAPLAPSDVKPDPAVSVTRRIEAADGGVIAEGKLVRVTLDWDVGPAALDGCYQVSDLVPSGLRPVTRYRRWDTLGAVYPYAVLGQRVSFCVSKEMKLFYQPIVYYARVVSKGTYVAEPAIIQSQKAPESINLSLPETIEIR